MQEAAWPASNTSTMTTSPNTSRRERRRRWFQFSIASVLILTALCALALGWWVAPFEREIEPDSGYYVGYLDLDVPNAAEARNAFYDRLKTLREVCEFRRVLGGEAVKHGP
ncbi:MAG: hypothetical protein ACYSWU_17400 [Planctomycetota bacterium]|jgi:hypothetical protein